MNRITEWFLEQAALKIFLLSLLGIPIYIWLFSIIYQLDKRRNENDNSFKKIVLGLVTIYPIVYFFFFISFFFNLIGANTFDLFDIIMPFHLTAMLCGLILMIIGANSYGKYEKNKGHKTYESIGIFFMLWFYFVGIWVLQPNLNKYIKESKTTANN